MILMNIICNFGYVIVIVSCNAFSFGLGRASLGLKNLSSLCLRKDLNDATNIHLTVREYSNFTQQLD